MKDSRYFNFTLSNLIIASVIPLLIWGPFFPDLIVSVSALFFLYHLIKNKDYYFFKKPIVIFLLFCIYCILNSIFVAEDTMLSFESSLFYFRIGLFSCFIWYLIDKNKNILKYFYYSLILCFSALVIDGYFQFFTGANLFGLKMSDTRVSSFFGDELIMGSYLSRLFPLLFALFLIKQKKKYEDYFIGLLFVLVDVLIFLSGERSSFFFLNLSTIFIIILIKDYQKFRLVTFILAIISIFILSINYSKFTERMFLQPVEEMNLIKKEKKIFFSPAHDPLIKIAYEMFKDKPIVGHGPKMFRLVCKNYKYALNNKHCMTHPHNFYMQLLAETGIVGFLFFFSALSYLTFAFFKQLKCIIFGQRRPFTDYQVCLLAGILITVWPFAPNGNYFNNWLMIVYSLPVGFYLQSIYSKKISDKEF